MSNYGLDEDDDFTPPQLPKRATKAAKDVVQTAIKAGNDIGFVPRSVPEKKDRRFLNKEPQGKILVTGPERVLDKLRAMSIQNNVPYWKVIEDLLDS